MPTTPLSVQEILEAITTEGKMHEFQGKEYFEREFSLEKLAEFLAKHLSANTTN